MADEYIIVKYVPQAVNFMTLIYTVVVLFFAVVVVIFVFSLGCNFILLMLYCVSCV